MNIQPVLSGNEGKHVGRRMTDHAGSRCQSPEEGGRSASPLVRTFTS